MDIPTEHPDWRIVLIDERRTLRWLALETGRPPRTVYAYSRGQILPSDEWLAEVSRVLGRPVSDPRKKAA